MAGGISWHYVLKFIITGDAAVGKSSLLVRLTDQRLVLLQFSTWTRLMCVTGSWRIRIQQCVHYSVLMLVLLSACYSLELNLVPS